MGLLDGLDLQTFDQVQAARFGKSLDKGPTRADIKDAKVKASDADWEACKKRVDVRDRHRCRRCKRKVLHVLDLIPQRAEHHHIVRRKKEPALLVDDRNVVLLCYACHEKVTHHKLHIVGKAKDMFEVNGKRYLNAAKPLVFAA